mmetsp:Transcript_184/g.174  ORF Transcript_184/g.174 Transcript_184/m.174 type:complete len:566 (-) Transcript_184:46-1743(-)
MSHQEANMFYKNSSAPPSRSNGSSSTTTSPPPQSVRPNRTNNNNLHDISSINNSSYHAKIGSPTHSTTAASSPYTEKSTIDQIEALEQALKIQIEKRMEVEMKLETMKQASTSTSQHNHTNKLENANQKKIHVFFQKVKKLILEIKHKQQSPTDVNNATTALSTSNEEFTDFDELLKAFVSEMDETKDNIDEVDDKVERKDVLWFLNELHWRFDNIRGYHEQNVNCMNLFIDQLGLLLENFASEMNTSNNANNGENNIESDDDDHELNGCRKATDHDVNGILTEKEMIISTLQGRIVQLEETINDYNHQNFSFSSSITDGQGVITENYRKLLEKHKHLETRHRNIINEMQKSITLKNEEINLLKQSLDETNELLEEQMDTGSFTLRGTNGHGMINGDDHNEPQYSQQQRQQQLQEQYRPSQSYKEIEIKSLMEDIEERNIVIDEMRMEIDRLNEENKVESSHQADKVRLHYLESIVHDLERKLAEAKGVNPSTTRYGSLSLFDIDYSWSTSMPDDGILTEVESSTLTEGLESKVKELTLLFKESEEKRELLKHELDELKSQRIIS